MAGSRRLLLGELTREEARALASSGGLIVVPVGSTEQHGPHLPLGTDFLHAEWVTRGAAERAATEIPLAVAPTLPFGSSHHHLPWGGTISISTEVYYRFLVEMMESLVTTGWQRIFIVNGHGGNHEVVQLVARDVALARPVDIVASSWWNLAWDVMVAEGAHRVGRMPGHSGVFETSAVMAMYPDLVRRPLPHRDDPGTTDPRGFAGLYRVELHGSWTAIDGYSDSPDLADPEAGRRYLDAAIGELARVLVDFHRSSSARR